MKKKKKENYLERIPVRREGIGWKEDEKGIVTLEIENRGFFNRLFQFLFFKPKVSFVHMEEFGSFLWKHIDGKKDLTALGLEMKEAFGERAEPLYERLSQYVETLHSYGFISFAENK